MPYRCQICKDCSDTEGVYQSDRDFPSEISDSDDVHYVRRWRRKYSRRYRHRGGRERTGYRRRTLEREGRRESGASEGDRHNRRPYRRRDDSNSEGRKTDNNDGIRTEGENYRRDNNRKKYMRDSDDGNESNIRNVSTNRGRDISEERDQSNSINDNDDGRKHYSQESKSDLLENKEKKKEDYSREENNQEKEDESFWNGFSESETETDSDSDKNDEDENAAHSPAREKRDANYQRREHHGGQRRGPAKPRRKRSLNISYVRLPSGNRQPIITPKPKEFKCGTPTTRITLHQNGMMSGKEYKIVENEMQNSIVEHNNCINAGGCFKKYEIVKIEKLINGCVWKRYRHFQQDIIDEHGYANQRMLFHGSAKVEDILNTGFDERYSNFDGMFGAGLYFAKHSSKANQYAYGYMGGTGCPQHSDKNCHLCDRKILLCRVTLGRSKNLYTGDKLAHPPAKHNSVVGVPSKQKGGLRYPEYIVYRGEQIYPEYMITYKIKD